MALSKVIYITFLQFEKETVCTVISYYTNIKRMDEAGGWVRWSVVMCRGLEQGTLRAETGREEC